MPTATLEPKARTREPSAGRKRCTNFNEVLLAYLPQAQRENSPRHYQEKTRYCRSFALMFGEIPIEDLRPFDLQEWLNTMPGVRSQSSIRQAANALRVALNWAVRMELIPKNGLHGFRISGV